MVEGVTALADLRPTLAFSLFVVTACANESPLGDLEGTYDLRELTPTLYGGENATCELRIDGADASASCSRAVSVDDPESATPLEVTESLVLQGDLSEDSIVGTLEYEGVGTNTDGCVVRSDVHEFSLDVTRTSKMEAEGLFGPAAGTWEGTVSGTSERTRASGDDCESATDNESWMVEFTLNLTGDMGTFDYTLNGRPDQLVVEAVGDVVEVDGVSVPKTE